MRFHTGGRVHRQAQDELTSLADFAFDEDVAAVVAWLCSPETAPINDRVFYIAGGQLSVFAEPELIRARFNPNGWNLDSLLNPQVTAQFTYGQHNRLAGR